MNIFKNYIMDDLKTRKLKFKRVYFFAMKFLFTQVFFFF